MLKIRIKFAKLGAMKFVGHLDTMRYFQKAFRRAQLPVAFSGGFSPHMIMSFAAPLGVGMTSSGEYFDVELTETMSTAEITRRLNEVMTEGMEVLGAVRVEDGKAGKAMSLVAAADYLVTFREGREFSTNWRQQFSTFADLPSIVIHKKTKRSEMDVDIRPFLYEARVENDAIFLKLAAASGNYTRPEQVMDAFADWLGAAHEPHACMIHRCEVYADTGDEQTHRFVTLQSLGEEIE